MGRMGRRAALVVVSCGLALGSCNDSTGPDLSVEVFDADSLAATGSSASVCCCRVGGEVLNQSSVPVNVTLRWRAYDASGADVGSGATAFIKSIPPGERKPIEPTGAFLVACASISRYERTRTDIQGLWMP
jgi:hypothetical protein